MHFQESQGFLELYGSCRHELCSSANYQRAFLLTATVNNKAPFPAGWSDLVMSDGFQQDNTIGIFELHLSYFSVYEKHN